MNKEISFEKLMLLSAVVGLIGGLGAVAFRYLIIFFQYLFYGSTSSEEFFEIAQNLPWYYTMITVTAGGLIVGLIVHFSRKKKVQGDGVPEVLQSVKGKEGVLDVIVAPLKALASAVTIGSGGSAGREGPIVQIGAAFGSTLANKMNLDENRRLLLLGAGAAAGIGGTFNAPIAGVIFAWEILLKEVKITDILPIMISSMVGTVVANLILGFPGLIFEFPEIEIVNYWEILLYVALGVLAGFIALIYNHGLHGTEDFFETLKLPVYLKPALGGLAVGIIAIYVPGIMSTGYPVLTEALTDNLSITLVAALLILKIVATSMTIGSGGSGGIFAPALYIGGMLGVLYSKFLDKFLSGLIGGATTYGTIGMGAVFAGATHAPLTAIVILYEMTGDVKSILPLTIACIISTMICRKISPESIYTKDLIQQK
jgi:chloride channel protein, CIC family